MESYEEMRKRHQKEYNEFPVAFAITNEDLKEGLKKLGMNENDGDKVVGIGFGGFVRKEDKQAYDNMENKHYKELQEAIKNDKTGEDFIQGMFETELANHEYGYTGVLGDTLGACGLTYKDVEKNANIQNGLKLAMTKCSEQVREDDEEEEIQC